MSWLWIICGSYLLLCVQGQGKKGFGSGNQDWDLKEIRPDVFMFWWLYYATPPSPPPNFNVYSKPLIIWLQGGPGGSSSGIGNFNEIGPLDLAEKPRSLTWVNDYNVLFIDNPAGTGFSRVGPNGTFPKNNLEVAQDLIACIKAFLSKNPDFKTVPTYLVGQSYGGKMGIELASQWIELQKQNKIESNFKGIALGDSWISPIDTVLSWAPFLYQTGLLDVKGRDSVQEVALRAKAAVDKQSWTEAADLWGETQDTIDKYVVKLDFTNILNKMRPDDTSQVDDAKKLKQFMNDKVAPQLGLTANFGDQTGKVLDALWDDFMKPVTEYVDKVRSNKDIKVIVYTGQLDLVVATPGTVAWVDRMFKAETGWSAADRKALVIDDIIEGYQKKYQNFAMYWILRSGHNAPTDNPTALKEIIGDLTTP